MKRLWLFAVPLLLAAAQPVRAIEGIESEQKMADSFPEDKDQSAEETEERRWAILPQLGYDPAAGALVGAKYTHRGLAGGEAVLDIDATYSMNQHQGAVVGLQAPHLMNDKFIFMMDARWAFDPQREFFGLGNNDFGPEPLSSYKIQDFGGDITVGWRPLDWISFNLGVRGRDVDIRPGKRLKECQSQDGRKLDTCPYTIDDVPDLRGIEGGHVVSLAGSMVIDSRDDMVRPTRGWRLILKAEHVLGAISDFEFTRYSGDASYLRSFFGRNLVIAFRINGEYMDGPQIPFWELSELGGSDTLRGFFPHRFLGESRVLSNLEVRGRLVKFNFFDIWQVQIDGVAFGETGRVFINRSDLRDEFHLNSRIFSRVVGDLQYSYGGGVRIALSEALVARIDAGFSEEETGLIYLSFGHTF